MPDRADHVRPTWSAARSPSSPSTCPTTSWCAATATRSTRWSTPSTTRSWRSPTCCAARTCSPAPRARSRCTTRSAEIGVGTGRPREFGHLPYVMGQGNKKLSKRDPEANLLGYRDRGFLPEGLLNYLALLGWAIADDRDIFSHGRDGRGLRHRAGQPEPGALRPQEGRGDQRHAPAGAAGRRS